MRNKSLKPAGILLMLAFSFIFQAAMAQPGNIKGQITGLREGETPVVNLLKASDSSFLKAGICDAGGKFEFELLRDGTYLISITHVGYQKYISTPVSVSNGHYSIQLPEITLQPGQVELQGVQVSGKKQFVQRKIDRVVINPDALIGNAGTSALEVLEKSPGILVDINGNISLKGKPGVVVFIDDKPTYMAAADLSNYLRSLPAGSIESVEIMTNPPARYDAAGNAGIINIKLKKNIARGVNGGLSLSYGQGRYLRTNNSFNINYRVNKVNLFSNISWNRNNSYQDLRINRYYYAADGSYSSGFTQNSYIRRAQSGQTARVGVDYYMNKQITLGAVVAGFINPASGEVTNSAKVLDATNNPVSLVAAYNPSDKKWKNGSINLNYAHKLDAKGRELSANADYIHYTSTYTQRLENNNYAPDGSLQSSSTLASTLPATISIQTIKTDYTHPLAGGGKADAGFKSSFVQTDNTASFFDVAGNNSTPNYDFSNRFRYKENINAAYLNYAKDWKKISVQLGLRLENTNIRGNQLGNSVIKDSSFTRHYTSLFPTLYLAYRIDSLQKHQLGFSFGRRINRPNYQDMNPFTYPLDRYTYYAGNPFLQPTFSYNFEISYTYKNFLTTTIEYGFADNLIQETNEQRGTIFYSRPGNFGRQTAWGIDVNGTFQLRKWWILQLYSEFKNLGYKSLVYGQELNEDRWYWYIGPTNQFILSKTLSAELAGSYQTRILVGQFLTIPVWQMRAGLSYRLFKGKGSVKLAITDLFYTNQPGGDIRNIARSKADWLSHLDSRVGTLTFTYRFNKGKSLNARQSGASDTEKGRIKTN